MWAQMVYLSLAFLFPSHRVTTMVINLIVP
jgi:hypothetical protein